MTLTGWWFVPVGFWLVGMLVMISGSYVVHKLSERRKKLHRKSVSTQGQDQSASIYFGLKQEMLNMMPWMTIRLFWIVMGMVIFAFGFVALSFVI